ncbi:hypothetical protein [Goodfellowiella coeruleoviolacea]|uniref:hypothetical protein n=1 Tax=Goodfellowiella coeruleoviolacea TaxID=334858 RepID=UPI0020A518D0|nr:hypothetical protein [Goodfellowiella coeruleoviolacea]
MTDPQQPGPAPDPEHPPVVPPPAPLRPEAQYPGPQPFPPQFPQPLPQQFPQFQAPQPMPWVAPMAPVGTAQTQSLPGPPTTVMAAFWCWLAGIVLSVLTTVLALVLPPDTADWLGGPGASLLGEQAREQTVTVVTGLVFGGLWAFFGFQMKAGRNWARIVLTVLVALNAVDAAVEPLLRGATGWAGLATDLATVVLMYLSSANAHFRYMKYV